MSKEDKVVEKKQSPNKISHQKHQYLHPTWQLPDPNNINILGQVDNFHIKYYTKIHYGHNYIILFPTAFPSNANLLH